MATVTLRELWETQLQDLYAAEQKILDALPDLIAAASSAELREALETHLQRTKVHVERLDLIFEQAGLTSGARVQSISSGIDGIVRSGSKWIRMEGAADVRDAAIIAAAQHVEHYEMAGYGCARTWAHQLDNHNAAHLLQQTLDEEGGADKELTRLAQSGINAAASAGGEFTGRPEARLRYVDVDDLPYGADRYKDAKIRSRDGQHLGTVDGFVVDPSGRPYYVVVDSGGFFVGRRYVVPVGRADFGSADRVFTIDLDKDTFKRFPEFHRDAFLSMSDDEARRYEWRVLEAIDPEAARASTGRDWDYDRYPYYRQPDWYDRDVFTPARAGGRSVSRTRTPEVPVVESPEREQVMAREERYETEEGVPPSARERIRGTPRNEQ
jgi:ferritin-like metal-binding protein YciE